MIRCLFSAICKILHTLLMFVMATLLCTVEKDPNNFSVIFLYPYSKFCPKLTTQMYKHRSLNLLNIGK